MQRIYLKCLIALIFGFCLSVSYAAEKIISNKDGVNFLTLADIHFTPFLSCKNQSPCKLAQRLKQAPASQWGAILDDEKTYAGYREDTNYRLLVSALKDASKTAQDKNARFVIVLGDTLAHGYRRLYKYYTGDKSFAGYTAFVNKTFQFVNDEIVKSFPKIDTYMVVGNNDAYRGDYATRVNGAFFKNEGVLWSGLIHNQQNRSSMLRTFDEAGYYAVKLLNHTRLVVLNTNLFSTKARGYNLEKTAKQQLNWLHDQLADAKKQKEAVLIAMHIPEGIDVYATLRLRGISVVELWKEKYIDAYQEEIEEYAPEVVAVFAGHLHSDWMQLLRFSKLNEVPVVGTPSISPVFGNNPGYKIYTYSPTEKKLTDFVTYYLSLDKKEAWNMEYQFKRIYAANCHDCGVAGGIDLIQKEGYLSDYYKFFYAVSTNNQPITTKWNPYYWCAIRNSTSAAYKKCLS